MQNKINRDSVRKKDFEGFHQEFMESYLSQREYWINNGIYFENSYFGGNLIKVEKDKHVDSYHEVHFKKSIFSDIYGYTKKLNSYHNFGINKQNISIKLTSLGNSGKSIECFKHKKKNIHGIMWHPERHSPFFDEDLNFFKKTLK